MAVAALEYDIIESTTTGFAVRDATGRVWNFELSVRARGRHPKPVIIGDWLLFVREKGLVVGDRIFLTKEEDGQNGLVRRQDLFFAADIKRRLAYPTQNLEAIPIPSGQNAVGFAGRDANGNVWNFKLSVRARGRHRKPVIIGDWVLYVRKKGLAV
ncbi:unnamed protein product [Dovyalis caffra]|uniref:TF-B3 domain-containing protein n=1 Tax=Dovyalis caffra TaxID=77055 RepID=A0AAV1SKY9_9ROSI|nr:unnamed protein product [Dovyalis caffra]